MPMSSNVPSIVTTVDANGKAVVLFDGDSDTVKRPDRPTMLRLLWVTGEMPAHISGPADRAALAMGKIGIALLLVAPCSDLGVPAGRPRGRHDGQRSSAPADRRSRAQTRTAAAAPRTCTAP